MLSAVSWLRGVFVKMGDAFLWAHSRHACENELAIPASVLSSILSAVSPRNPSVSHQEIRPGHVWVHTKLLSLPPGVSRGMFILCYIVAV